MYDAIDLLRDYLKYEPSIYNFGWHYHAKLFIQFLKFAKYEDYNTLIAFSLSLCIDKLWNFNHVNIIEKNIEVLSLNDYSHAKMYLLLVDECDREHNKNV